MIACMNLFYQSVHLLFTNIEAVGLNYLKIEIYTCKYFKIVKQIC